MNKPLVSVFIAVYNGELYIRESLESIINQTYKNLEILIIDDGSTDNTCSIISEYNDNRIRLIKNEINKGLPYTRNKAIELFKGKYLATLDADDISMPFRIEEQVKILEQNKDIDVVTSDYIVFKNRISKRVKVNKNIESIKISLIFGCSLCNSTSMIRAESIERFNIKYNPLCFIAQDYELWSKFSMIGKIYNIPKPLVKYRIGHENITKKTKISKINERKLVISNIQDNMLNYYGFILNNKEKRIFFDLFSDTYDVNLFLKYDSRELKLLIDKLIKINKEKSIFNEELFLDVLNKSTNERIFNQNIKLIYKFKLYKSVIYNKDILSRLKDINRMLLKHIQISIKNIKTYK